MNGTKVDIFSSAYAASLDAEDPVPSFRSEFIIPSKPDLERKTLSKTPTTTVAPSPNATNHTDDAKSSEEESIYLCGNSLGVQPRGVATYISSYLATWAQKGVYGHFRELEDALCAPWMHMDDQLRAPMARVVGARPEEVAVMESLTTNLHLLMASFYKPTKERYKIIIEGKAFPSDHYAVVSQLAHHNIPPSALITITPPAGSPTPYLPTSHILSIISEHAATTALVLLPGIQYYSGQLLDVRAITAHAHSLDIPIGWDLAHAAGNVPLSLHDWDVDFAAWCTYKYLNAGPGAIGALFVHERHGAVHPPPSSSASSASSAPTFRPRLSGWWGQDKRTRFAMGPTFVPTPGAAGFQVSNPSALDLAALLASLRLFDRTDMPALAGRSRRLTAYLEQLLLRSPARAAAPRRSASGDLTNREGAGPAPLYEVITPADPGERGAQLSVRFAAGLMPGVMARLEREGVVVDERKPDVIRVAPAPLYNTFADVQRFAAAWERAVDGAVAELAGVGKGEGEERNGW